MTVYQPGQRITLVATTDQYTDLRPGATGTVRRHDQALHTVHIDWDSGSRLSMCLDAGDRVAAATPKEPAGGDPVGWVSTLAQLRTAGAEAGRDVADRWAADTLGARAGGDAPATARDILAGIADGDPAVLDGLPTFTPPAVWHDGCDSAEVRYREAAGDQTLPWRELTDDQRAATIAVSRAAFDTEVLERVTALCLLATSPTGRDVSHLHPDHLRIGRVGVFAGDWAQTSTGRIPVGFVGTLIDTWNGWAVFSCSRTVAEAIVADQQEQRRQVRETYRARGLVGDALDRRVDTELADLRFDGDDILADERVMHDDPQALDRIHPDDDGQYVIMGWHWCWQAADPYDCDRLVGDVPDPDQAQRWVPLPHTGLRVPHDRLKATGLQQTPTPHRSRPAWTATLTLDDHPVATIRDDGDGDGGAIDLVSDLRHWGRQQMVDYAAACRHHGQPVTVEQVLAALVAERETHQAIGEAEASGGALARLREASGAFYELRTVTPAPAGVDHLLALGGLLTRESPGQQWEIWTGSRWFVIPGDIHRPYQP